MAKPLQSETPKPKSLPRLTSTAVIKPASTQFSHFGVLDDGKSSRAAAATSIIVNLSILALIIVVGLLVKNNPTMAKKLDEIYLPVQPPPPPPIIKRPPPPPPMKLQPPPPTPPKIKLPEVEKLPELKPIPAPPVPKPVVAPPAPVKTVIAPPAPVHVNLGHTEAAAVANHDAHPSAVSLGQADNPLKSNLSGPAVSKINLGGAGSPGASGAGNGPSKVSLGNGTPGGAFGSRGAGSATRSGPIAVTAFNNAPAAPPASRPNLAGPVLASPPKVLYKPSPVYSKEAKDLHLEGNVKVRIKVLASGAVQVESIISGLGHGLDESARQAVLGTRFKPATDSTGAPIDWEGTVVVNFIMA